MSGFTTPLDFGARQRVYTVAEFTAELKELLNEEYPDVKVSGEISNARRYPSGHWYFTLKDRKAQISCVCFRRDALYLKSKPEDGLAVVARGRVSVYERQGKYQLYVEALEPRGVGALQLKFERLKAKLQEQGLFDQERKRALPVLPRRIGIVTSPSGAVIADMLRIMERRFPGLWIKLYPVRVQGRGAAAEIAAGIRFFSERPWAEVVIVGRGGGSLEDLWAFNEEIVARAIAASEVPMVSAVGHQTDFTIADFVADLRAATPSAAAELVVPEARGLLQAFRDAEERSAKAMSLRLARLRTRVLETSMERAARTVESRIDDAWQALDAAVRGLSESQERRIRRARERLDRSELQLAALDLRVRLARQSERLSTISQRLLPALRRTLDGRASRLASLDGSLRALSPVAILERGYAIVQTCSGSAVRETWQVAEGDLLAVRLHKGRLAARVEDIEPEPGDPPPANAGTV